MATVELRFPDGEPVGPVPTGMDMEPGPDDAGVASALLLDPAGEVAFPLGEDGLAGAVGPFEADGVPAGPVGEAPL